MTKRIVGKVFKYGLGLGLLAYVVWSNWHIDADGQEVGISGVFERTFHWGPLALAASVCLTSILITFVRWYVLVRAQHLPFTLGSAVRLGLIGFYLSTFLPGSVGGDIIKAAFLAREQSRRTVAVATVLVDRGIGLCGLIWLVALIGSMFWATGALEGLVQTAAGRIFLEFIVCVAVGLVAGSFAFWFLMGFLSSELAGGLAHRLERLPTIGHSLAELWGAIWMYRLQGKSVALALFMAMVAHVGFVFTFYLCSITLNPQKDIPTLGTHYLIVPVGMTIQAGFPAPGGVGGGEWGYGWLYAQAGAGTPAATSEVSATKISPEGVLACLMQRCLFWALGLVGYFVYLRLRPTLTVVDKLGPSSTMTSDRAVAV